MLWILSKIYELRSDIGVVNATFTEKLDAHTEKVSKILDKEKEESIQCHRRIDIHDAISSQITEKPFRSKPLVETGDVPKVHTSLQRLVAGGDRDD